MSGDGNCGFRAVAFEVYKDEGDWYKVKQKMKNTYLKYKDTLYKGVGTEMENKVEEDIMMERLDSFKSPCLGNDDLLLWFSTFTCPQVVADTYQRPVILYCYLENFVNGEIRRFYESQVFFPLIEMEMSKTEYPISLLLSHSHFYSIEYQRAPTGRLRKFTKPTINRDHARIRRDNPTLRFTDFSILYT
ncbi:hypothetical protein BDB01DRAFT_787166 [Pilobolus umbonatus]|nr:hypothetical protein BDB01DRAFT_787166 [Pilobolus umbonatus]